jgi:hypothetical protein
VVIGVPDRDPPHRLLIPHEPVEKLGRNYRFLFAHTGPLGGGRLRKSFGG